MILSVLKISISRLFVKYEKYGKQYDVPLWYNNTQHDRNNVLLIPGINNPISGYFLARVVSRPIRALEDVKFGLLL
jgi:hypothetical protein